MVIHIFTIWQLGISWWYATDDDISISTFLFINLWIQLCHGISCMLRLCYGWSLYQHQHFLYLNLQNQLYWKLELTAQHYDYSGICFLKFTTFLIGTFRTVLWLFHLQCSWFLQSTHVIYGLQLVNSFCFWMLMLLITLRLGFNKMIIFIAWIFFPL